MNSHGLGEGGGRGGGGAQGWTGKTGTANLCVTSVTIILF